MDRLASMSLLLDVVREGSLSAAGRRLGMPLATVSRKITDLEDHLNVRLLNRSNRKLSLTEAGEAYAASCRRILDAVNDAERAASGEYGVPKGELFLTAPIVFGRLHVLPVVAAFLQAYPDIRIHMKLADRVANLLEDNLDLAVRIARLPDSSLVSTTVGHIRSVVCASPDYLARRGVPTRPQDIADHDCVVFEGVSTPDHWRFRSGKSDLLVPVRSRLSVNTAEAAIDAAVAGLGLTRVFSYQVESPLKQGVLALVLEPFEPLPLPVSLVHAGQRLLPQKLRTFLDFATPRLRARLSEAAIR